jgi:hypothetical protein
VPQLVAQKNGKFALMDLPSFTFFVAFLCLAYFAGPCCTFFSLPISGGGFSLLDSPNCSVLISRHRPQSPKCRRRPQNIYLCRVVWIGTQFEEQLLFSHNSLFAFIYPPNLLLLQLSSVCSNK